MNNFEIMCQRSIVIDETNQNHEEFVLSMYQFVSEWYKVLNQLLLLKLDESKHLSPRINRFPQFSFGVCIQEDIDDYLLKLHKEGKLDAEDLVMKKPRLFLNRYPGWFFITVRGKITKCVENSIHSILELRDLFYKKGLLETMLYISPEGTTVEFDDSTGMRKITLPNGTTVESVLEKEGITARKIETYTVVFDWNSFFREMATETLKSVPIGKGEENLGNLKKEDEEIYRAYSCIKDYSVTFREFYGIELEAFFNIISEITYMCYNNIHTIGCWKYPNLLKEKVLTKFSPQDIERAVQLLSESPKSEKTYDGFVPLDDNVLTNFRRLGVSRTILLEKCFGEVFNNDLKGKAFEEACRQMLREARLRTLPERIQIAEPTVPTEIAFTLWGRQKQKTDIDVVSSQNNRILVIECKEIKTSNLESRKQKQFKKYVVEHFHKINWIRSNFEKFESYAGTDFDQLSIDKRRPVYLFPLVVTNRLVTLDGIIETPLITYLELKKIVSSINRTISQDEQSGVLEFKIGVRRITLPWVSALVKEYDK